jgi:hypothetical protein
MHGGDQRHGGLRARQRAKYLADGPRGRSAIQPRPAKLTRDGGEQETSLTQPIEIDRVQLVAELPIRPLTREPLSETLNRRVY